MKMRRSAGGRMRLLIGTVYRTGGVGGVYFFDLQNSSVPPPSNIVPRFTGGRVGLLLFAKRTGRHIVFLFFSDADKVIFLFCKNNSCLPYILF
jgi:hypothetical protein